MKKHLLKALFIITSVALLLSPSLNSQDNKAPAEVKDYVKVFYFHGERRCQTCNNIEKMTKTAVQNNFSNELTNGKVKIESVNFEKDENKKYVKDFQLYSSSVIIVKYKNGKQIEWKNCQKIWELVRNQPEFMEYIKKEVNSYLGRS